jgi:hypothetical protein
MSPKSADKKGFYILYLILMKNESQIGRRPIKKDILSWIFNFVFNFVEK